MTGGYRTNAIYIFMKALDGVAEVYCVEKTNVAYSFSEGTHTTSAKLERLGCRDGQIRVLLYLEGYLITAVGLLIFALLYGGYVGSVTAAIRETNAYQYSGFVLAWREIAVIAGGIVAGIGVSGALFDPGHRKGERHII